jgi:predicted negative regulator of RcsB-dependent stress response
VQLGRVPEALVEFEQVLKAVPDHPKANYNLGLLAMSDKQYDEALRTLDVKTDEAFAGVYADLKGDIFAAAGKLAEAKASYQLALAKIDAKSPYRAFVQVKFDALGGAP